jgi:hypothetical protein
MKLQVQMNIKSQNITFHSQKRLQQEILVKNMDFIEPGNFSRLWKTEQIHYTYTIHT